MADVLQSKYIKHAQRGAQRSHEIIILKTAQKRKGYPKSAQNHIKDHTQKCTKA